jgi:hypothetical protein
MPRAYCAWNGRLGLEEGLSHGLMSMAPPPPIGAYESEIMESALSFANSFVRLRSSRRGGSNIRILCLHSLFPWIARLAQCLPKSIPAFIDRNLTVVASHAKSYPPEIAVKRAA